MGNFVASLFLRVLLPFTPLFVEVWQHGAVNRASLILVGAVYSCLIGISSEYGWIFAFCLFTGVFLALASGNLGPTPKDFSLITSPAFYFIGLVTLFHAGERFYRHYYEERPFFLFVPESN